MTFFYIQLFQLIDGDRSLKGSKMKFFICNKDLINVPWLSLKKKKIGHVDILLLLEISLPTFTVG